MKDTDLKASLSKLYLWIKNNGYAGWDPYDWSSSPLSSKIPKKLDYILSQINVYSPLNLRKFFGIDKGVSNKGLALFAQAYTLEYVLTEYNEFKKAASNVLNLLYKRKLNMDSGVGWASHYFPFIRENHILLPESPDIVGTVESLKAYTLGYFVFKYPLYKEISIKSINSIIDNFVSIKYKPHISYYPKERNKIVFNVSALVLSAISNLYKYNIFKSNILESLKDKLVNVLVDSQNPDGSWPYSYYFDKKVYKFQNDYHQGFIIDGLVDIYPYYSGNKELLEKCIDRGVAFYKNYLFNPAGWSYYRPPKFRYPIDIHNQAQGIITFSKLYKLFKDENYLDFAMKIAEWTIKNMQSPEGYFYTHRWPFMVNKIPYIRWGQAWMMLALSTLLSVMKDGEDI